MASPAKRIADSAVSRCPLTAAPPRRPPRAVGDELQVRGAHPSLRGRPSSAGPRRSGARRVVEGQGEARTRARWPRGHGHSRVVGRASSAWPVALRRLAGPQRGGLGGEIVDLRPPGLDLVDELRPRLRRGSRWSEPPTRRAPNRTRDDDRTRAAVDGGQPAALAGGGGGVTGVHRPPHHLVEQRHRLVGAPVGGRRAGPVSRVAPGREQLACTAYRTAASQYRAGAPPCERPPDGQRHAPPLRGTGQAAGSGTRRAG